MHWKNMKIGARLALGFGALAALLAIVAAITLSQIGALNDEIGLTNAERYPKTVLAHLVKDKLGENAVSLRNLLLLDDGAAIQAELLGIAGNTRDIGAALARLESSIGAGPGRVLFDQLKEVRRQFLDGRQHYLELYQRRELDLARAALQGQSGQLAEVASRFKLGAGAAELGALSAERHPAAAPPLLAPVAVSNSRSAAVRRAA